MAPSAGPLLRVSAPAKINLGIEILGRRPDGYHELLTILQAIDLRDELSLVPAPELGLTGDRDLGPIEANLVLRAARLLQEETGTDRGATIHLAKRIPVAAGLGGGSADAAATLLGLNHLWELNLPPQELAQLAARLGSDVPFFLQGGARLASGRGEALAPLPTPRLWVVLVLSPTTVADKTKRLYAALGPADFSSGEQVRSLAERLRRGESVAGQARPSGFERAALRLFPGIARAFSALCAAGAIPSLCGAGPTALSLHDHEAETRRVATRVQAEGLAAIVAPTIEDGVTII